MGTYERERYIFRHWSYVCLIGSMNADDIEVWAGNDS